jgi:hypothetical protein
MHGIDEGELEIEPIGHYASSLLYCIPHPAQISSLLDWLNRARVLLRLAIFFSETNSFFRIQYPSRFRRCSIGMERNAHNLPLLCLLHSELTRY